MIDKFLLALMVVNLVLAIAYFAMQVYFGWAISQL